MRTCRCRADWGDFLHVRHLLINEWLDAGRTPEQVAKTLSMDPGQVRLIGWTPLAHTHIHVSVAP